jgi:ubiquinone biosynthesis protein Coq4
MIYQTTHDIYNKLTIMENKVLTQEEIQSLKNIQDNQLSLAEQLGFLEYRILILEIEKQKLKQTLQSQIETEEQLAKQLQEKYGDGNINLEKGEFIPVS